MLFPTTDNSATPNSICGSSSISSSSEEEEEEREDRFRGDGFWEGIAISIVTLTFWGSEELVEDCVSELVSGEEEGRDGEDDVVGERWWWVDVDVKKVDVG